MKAIHILTPPPGFADEHIREQWVGIKIPLVSDEEAKDVEGRFQSDGENDNGYIVRGVDAVNALTQAERWDAVAFWGAPRAPSHLMFARECCEVVEL